MAKPPTPTLAERLFEKCTVLRCARSRRGGVCPACAELKTYGQPLCRNCRLSLTPALAAELEHSKVRFGYEQAMHRALLELKANDFYEAALPHVAGLPPPEGLELKE